MKATINRAMCAMFGHRWVYRSSFPFLGGGEAKHSAKCKRCGLEVAR